LINYILKEDEKVEKSENNEKPKLQDVIDEHFGIYYDEPEHL
jgi:hypothetical protein